MKLGLSISLIFMIRSVVWSQQIVDTTSGLIQGTAQDTFVQYLGIPYAEPPTGLNRFKPTVSVIRSNQLIQANTLPASCMQNRVDFQAIVDGAIATTNDDPGLAGMGEDCLYLNIYTPASTTPLTDLLPVMMFIHGGNFVRGTGSAFKGANLAAIYDVVVVTFNYRLGAFGFLSGGNDDISGNYGILDQKMAIRWIKENIEAFGGDPEAITLFGEEAGGSSAHIHLLGAENNLFQNVIIQSPQYDDGMWSESQCVDQYTNFVSLLGFNGNNDVGGQLRAATASTLQIYADVLNDWRPCNHSKILTDFPSVVMNQVDSLSNISVLCGTNSAVGSDHNVDVTTDTWLYNVTDYVVRTTFPQLYGTVDSDVINYMSQNYYQFYAGYGMDESADIERNNFASNTFGDQYYKTWVQEIARVANTASNSVYKYMYTEETQTTGGEVIGAPLSAELPYIFGYQTTTITSRTLSTTMMTYWTNFAKTGNPNLPVAPNSILTSWPPYDATSIDDSQCRNVIELNSRQTRTPSSDNAVSRTLDFWTVYYEILGFSCVTNDIDSSVLVEETCEPSVQDAIGMAVTNEEAGIMLIVFITLTGVFLIASLITSFCCWRYKKKFQRQKKKNKSERSGHDNPSTSVEYKL